MGRRKKEKSEGIEFKGVIDFSLPFVFCVKCDAEREAHELKGFIDYWLKVQGSKVRYEYYRISPFDDIVFLYHKHDELDLPAEVRFYKPNTILTGLYVSIKKDHVVHRTEKDFKKLNE